VDGTGEFSMIAKKKYQRRKGKPRYVISIRRGKKGGKGRLENQTERANLFYL